MVDDWGDDVQEDVSGDDDGGGDASDDGGGDDGGDGSGGGGEGGGSGGSGGDGDSDEGGTTSEAIAALVGHWPSSPTSTSAAYTLFVAVGPFSGWAGVSRLAFASSAGVTGRGRRGCQSTEDVWYRRDLRDRSSDWRDDRDRNPDQRDDKEWRPHRPPVTCFSCNEPGHYANQCPLQERRQLPCRPSTSSDSRRTRSPRRFESRREHSPRKESELRETVAKLSKGVASIKEHVNAVQAKKDEKARRKLEKEKEKEDERRRLEEEEVIRSQEEARREAKLRKKEKKAKQEAALRAEMKKDVTMHAAILISEIKDD
ncbi:hypothetical protein CBR_g31643 [Chara braunii]|uniref:CCHC-type domain-containing protein n=1 Tax=Chara braunii TaxID=69332 RepID=A0A388LFJ5_CHABU|nr:hypothetical protein CBR_g31643 [Chara braunii]|eukprot:GBG81085.1 hypothetical protein CBR_g31643 [Chara braunii]